MASASVGSRELKTRLGAYLRRVREGRTFVVTDRGEPVAELRPVERPAGGLEDKLGRLHAAGRVARPVRRRLGPFTAVRLPKGVSAAERLAEDREDRF